MAKYTTKTQVKFIIKKEFKEHLKFRGFTVNSLADKLGYTKQQVSQTLNGEIEPTRQFLRKVCAFLKIGAEDILITVFE